MHQKMSNGQELLHLRNAPCGRTKAQLFFICTILAQYNGEKERNMQIGTMELLIKLPLKIK